MAAALSTGFPAADDALSGGYPRGKLTALQGISGVRIPVLRAAVSAAQNARAPRQVVAWIDCAGKFSAEAFTAAGVDLERLLVSQPDNAEQALEVAAVLARSGSVDLVVVDGADDFTPDMVEQLTAHARSGSAAVVLGVVFLASRVEALCAVTVSLSPTEDLSHVDLWLRRHTHALGEVPGYSAPVAWVDASEPEAPDYDPSDPALLVNILKEDSGDGRVG